MIWKTSKLAEISKIGDGAHASLKRVELGIPYLTAKNITKSGVDYSNMDYISEDTYNKHFTEKSNALTQPKKDDILYSIIGSIGGVYLVRDEKIGISSSVAIFRVNDEIVIPQYFFYFLKSNSFDAQVQAIKGGVAQGFMSLGKLGTITISYPNDIDYQKKIVDILSAYDCLIENNQKQIKLLEEGAQRLYKEWFVDLRFPGYENIIIVNGVPEGWKKKRVGEVVTTLSGGTPSRSRLEFYENGKHLWLKTKELDDNYIFDTEEKISDDAIKKSSAKYFKKGSIILAMYGATIGKLGIAAQDMTCNQACCVFDVSEFIDGAEYLYCWLAYNRKFLISQGKGSAQSNLSQQMIKEFEILIPDNEVLTKFALLIQPCFRLKENLQKQNMELNKVRDALLPKLMNGKMEV